jgi:nucleoside-diphosphate-sugar epimerase
MTDKNQMKDKSVLVTGGLGFIGSNLSHKLLNEGAKVTIVDSNLEGSGANIANISSILNKVSFEKQDVRGAETIDLVKGAQVVFHLAAQTNRVLAMENPILDCEINYSATLNILEACRKNEALERLVFTSSRAVVGEPQYLPVDEKHPTKPKDVYAANKLAAEQACLLYKDLYSLPVVIARPSNVYGPRGQLRNPNYGIINLFIGNVITGRPVPVFGNGSQTRDPIFVDDLIDALVDLSVERNAIGEVFLVGSGEEVSITQLANLVVKTYGRGTIKYVEFPKFQSRADVTRFRVNYTKLANIVGWHPKVGLEEGIEKTIQFYQGRLTDYV